MPIKDSTKRKEYDRRWSQENRPWRPKHPLQVIPWAKLANVLHRLNRRKRWSYGEIAAALGVSKTYVYMLIHGRRKPLRLRETTAENLAFLLECT